MSSAKYKLNTQKSVAFLYLRNEKYKNEIKKTILLIISLRGIKHSRINLTKHVYNLHVENYKIPLKKLKKT